MLFNFDKRKMLLLLVLSSISVCSFCQNFKEKFIHFTTKDGLSNNGISCIYQDSQGFMWIGTSDGLNRFDGKIFKTFFHEEGDSNSLASNNALSIVENKIGNLIIGCSEGVCVFNRSKNIFKKVFTPNNLNSKERAVQKVLFDNYGRLWVSTRFEIYVLDNSFKLIKILRNELVGSSPINQDFNFLNADPKGNIWIGKVGCLNKINPQTFEVINRNHNATQAELFQHMDIGGFSFDKNGNMWGIQGRTNLAVFDSNGKQIIDENNNYKISAPYSVISFHAENKMLVGSESLGAYIYDLRSGEVKNYMHHDNDYNSLCCNNVSVLTEDANGNIWIGTVNGLDVLPYQPCRLNAWDNFGIQMDGVTKNSISALRKGDNSICIANWGKGVDMLDLTTGLIESFETGKTNREKLVWDLIPSNNEIWYGNFLGLHALNPNTKQIRNFKKYIGYTNDLDSLAFFNFFKDSHKHIWMSLGEANGAIRYNVANSLFERFTQRRTDKYFLPFRNYSAVAEDYTGTLWFGYNRAFGLATYSYQNNKFEFAQRNHQPVFNYQVNCLLADSLTLWIGSNSGLYKMNLKTFEIKNYSRNDGLPNNLVSCITKTPDENIWVCTDNGFVKFNPTTETFYDVSGQFELTDNKITNCIYDSDAKRIYFSSTNTLFSFCVDSLSNTTKTLNPAVTQVSVMGNEINFNLDSTIAIDYNDNYFSLEYTAPNLPFAGSNKYAYKLVGFDKDWNFAGNRQFASYTNLKYGNYYFHLKASTDGIHWNEIKKPIKIFISAPFYLKTWFLVLVLFSIAIVAFLLIYIRYRIKLQRILDAQKIRNKIASDLHDDIGSTLSSISYMSEIAKQKTKVQSTEAENWFDKIGESSRSTIENMNDIVWSVNPQNDSFESMLIRMQNFASALLEARNINLKFDAANNLNHKKLNMEQRRNLFLIYKEIINNMAKHSGCKNVSIKLTEEHSKIKLEISDDGKGFDTTTSYAGNGIRNITKRAKDIHALLNVSSIVNNGTVFTIIL